MNTNDMTPIAPAAFCDVFALLERFDVPYVVVSGMAVVLHGYQRPVFDLDIVIADTPEGQTRAQHALLTAGFVSTIPIPLRLAPVSRMFDQAEREIDVFSRYHIAYDQLRADSVQIDIGESRARVASFEHLIQAKGITGRPHDLKDIEGLLALARERGDT